MTDTTLNARVSLHSTAWAIGVAADINVAAHSVVLSALSMLRPTPHAKGPWPELWRALHSARQRGVTVDIYLPTPQPAHPATANNFHTSVVGHALGFTTHFVPGPTLLHTKCCIIDASIAWIGSGNFTAAAAGHNHELYARIESLHIATLAVECLSALLQPH